MSVLSFKEVMLGSYTVIPMMLPLLKVLLELSLEPRHTILNILSGGKSSSFEGEFEFWKQAKAIWSQVL